MSLPEDPPTTAEVESTTEITTYYPRSIYLLLRQIAETNSYKLVASTSTLLLPETPCYSTNRPRGCSVYGVYEQAQLFRSWLSTNVSDLRKIPNMAETLMFFPGLGDLWDYLPTFLAVVRQLGHQGEPELSEGGILSFGEEYLSHINPIFRPQITGGTHLEVQVPSLEEAGYYSVPWRGNQAAPPVPRSDRILIMSIIAPRQSSLWLTEWEWKYTMGSGEPSSVWKPLRGRIPYKKHTRLRVSLHMVWDVFRLLSELLVRILDRLGGDIDRLESLLRNGPSDGDRLVGVVTPLSGRPKAHTESFIRYQQVQIV